MSGMYEIVAGIDKSEARGTAIAESIAEVRWTPARSGQAYTTEELAEGVVAA